MYLHIYICTYTYIYIYRYIHVYIYIYACILLHASIYIHIYLNKHTWLTRILANTADAFTTPTVPHTAADPEAKDLIVSVSLAHLLAVIATRNASHIKGQVRQ